MGMRVPSPKKSSGWTARVPHSAAFVEGDEDRGVGLSASRCLNDNNNSSRWGKAVSCSLKFREAILRLEYDDALKLRKYDFHLLPDPNRDIFCGRIFETFNVI